MTILSKEERLQLYIAIKRNMASADRKNILAAARVASASHVRFGIIAGEAQRQMQAENPSEVAGVFQRVFDSEWDAQMGSYFSDKEKWGPFLQV